MSAFYGVPEPGELEFHLDAIRPQARVEPVDDERYITAQRMPERDFAPVNRSGRYTRTYSTPTRAEFGGVDFEAMVS